MNRWFESAGVSSEFVSLERFLDPYIFATQSGAYGSVFRIRGIDPECLSDTELANVSSRLVQAMRLLPEDCSLYQMLIKRRGCALPQSRYADSANEVIAETQRKRHEYLTTRPLGTVELYWTICFHPPKGRKQPQPGEHAV
ncbi:MAG: hypothetical protein JOZ62_20990, partial [Acidobacteriaceae bacterium]|nr:hypothetical protein [Acidobacteriaceae bacterium]